MTWLVRLYPPAWRRRYGRELADLIATQPASYGLAMDLIAGAVDAWLNPQSSTATAAADTGGGAMVSRMLQLRCAGHGPTKADALKAAAVMLGGTLMTTMALTWAIWRYGKDPYLEALLSVSWLVMYLVSQHYTDYKGRPARVQAVLIGGPAVLVVAIVMASAWVNSR
jgi:hypothetical protein